MFNLSQINELHGQFGKLFTLTQYLQALHAIGVVRFDSFITDGHSEYYGEGSHKITSPKVHNKFSIAPKCSP